MRLDVEAPGDPGRHWFAGRRLARGVDLGGTSGAWGYGCPGLESDQRVTPTEVAAGPGAHASDAATVVDSRVKGVSVPVAGGQSRSSLEQRRRAAARYVESSEGDLGLIVCLTKEGTLAGTIAVDLLNPGTPLSQDVKDESCAIVFKGSHAGV